MPTRPAGPSCRAATTAGRESHRHAAARVPACSRTRARGHPTPVRAPTTVLRVMHERARGPLREDTDIHTPVPRREGDAALAAAEPLGSHRPARETLEGD